MLRKQNIDISTFVNDVWNILNQKFPKKNLLVLQGVPDSGKSTIARSIVDLFQHAATVQGTASFPFMSLVNVEIGLIEELNMTMETLQTFKKIAEGVDTEVCIKYGADQTIKRTPLIITSNHDFDQHAQYIERQAFKSRYIKYQFTIASDFLAKAKKPLNPALWNSLFEEYVLSEDTSSDSDIALSSFLDEYEKTTALTTEKRKSATSSQPATPTKNETDRMDEVDGLEMLSNVCGSMTTVMTTAIDNINLQLSSVVSLCNNVNKHIRLLIFELLHHFPE